MPGPAFHPQTHHIECKSSHTRLAIGLLLAAALASFTVGVLNPSHTYDCYQNNLKANVTVTAANHKLLIKFLADLMNACGPNATRIGNEYCTSTDLDKYHFGSRELGLNTALIFSDSPLSTCEVSSAESVANGFHPVGAVTVSIFLASLATFIILLESTKDCYRPLCRRVCNALAVGATATATATATAEETTPFAAS